MIAAPWRRCRQLLLFGTWLRHRFDAPWMGCFSTVACWAWFFGAAVLSRCEPGGATCTTPTMVQGADTFRRAYDLPAEAATAALARLLAPALQKGDVIALQGDLGAGKTSFARALINSLEGGPEEVPSPTFTLVQTYQRGALEIWHFDLYRLEDQEEAWELGLEEALAEGESLIEWPDRLGSALPAERLDLTLHHSGEGRKAELVGRGSWAGRLAALQEELP
mgnify:CR=1 FL=1